MIIWKEMSFILLGNCKSLHVRVCTLYCEALFKALYKKQHHVLICVIFPLCFKSTFISLRCNGVILIYMRDAPVIYFDLLFGYMYMLFSCGIKHLGACCYGKIINGRVEWCGLMLLFALWFLFLSRTIPLPQPSGNHYIIISSINLRSRSNWGPCSCERRCYLLPYCAT